MANARADLHKDSYKITNAKAFAQPLGTCRSTRKTATKPRAIDNQNKTRTTTKPDPNHDQTRDKPHPFHTPNRNQATRNTKPQTTHKQTTDKQQAKVDSTLRYSQAVPDPSTNRALSRLTSEVRRDPVHSTRYGFQRTLLSAAVSSVTHSLLGFWL